MRTQHYNWNSYPWYTYTNTTPHGASGGIGGSLTGTTSQPISGPFLGSNQNIGYISTTEQSAQLTTTTPMLCSHKD